MCFYKQILLYFQLWSVVCSSQRSHPCKGWGRKASIPLAFILKFLTSLSPRSFLALFAACSFLLQLFYPFKLFRNSNSDEFRYTACITISHQITDFVKDGRSQLDIEWAPFWLFSSAPSFHQFFFNHCSHVETPPKWFLCRKTNPLQLIFISTHSGLSETFQFYFS